MELVTLSVEPESVQKKKTIAWEFDGKVISAQTDNYSAVITGLAQGETTLRASIDGITASCVVTVTSENVSNTVTNPYVYSNADFVTVAPGETTKVAASLYGGNAADVSGYTFSIDKPAVASLTSEANYVWVTGVSDGVAKVTVRHQKASYTYSFLVSCQNDGRSTPYITTTANIFTINKSVKSEDSFYVDLQNPVNASYEQAFQFTLTDKDGASPSSPPVSITTAGKQCVVKALAQGECYVRVSHPQAAYPLDVLVRVTEQIDTVYIEPSVSTLVISGAASETVSLSLRNLPQDTQVNPLDFTWIFDADASRLIDWQVYGGAAISYGGFQGDSAWITGTGAASGALKITVSHPLAAKSRDIYVIVRNVAAEASSARTFVTTSQNYVSTYAGAPDTTVSITLNNAAAGKENSLSWHIINTADDGSQDPVISYAGGTGTSTSASSRAATRVTSGYAVISPLKPGSAVIVISHPDAVYDTKILVHVAATNAASASSFSLSAPSSLLTVKNGETITASVSLSGSGVSEAEKSSITWTTSSASLSLVPSGASALVTASGSGASREYITVSHPKAPHSFSIAVLRYDEGAQEDQLASLTTLYNDAPYYTVFQNDSVYISPTVANPQGTETFSWNAVSGNNSVIAFSQESNNTAKISGLAPGQAEVSVSLSGTAQSTSYYFTVKRQGVVDEKSPCYLTTSQNVVLLNKDETAEIEISPVNIAAYTFSQTSWQTDSPSLVSLSPHGASASVTARAASGRAKITVSHPLAANSLEIYIHMGEEFEFKNTDIAYISPPQDVLRLHIGDNDTPFTAALAHSESASLDTTGFSFSVANTSVASLFTASDGSRTLITPLSTGQTTLTVSHPQASCDKTVLVIVDRKEGSIGEIPYLSTSQNVITLVAGEYATASVSLQNAAAQDSSSWTWVSENPLTASVVTNNGSTAMLHGNSPGSTTVSVSNLACQTPLTLIVICLDAASASQRPWIKTSTNIISLREGDSSTVTAEVAGASSAFNNNFLWSAANPSVALVSGSSNALSVKALKTGATYITVRNTAFQDAYAKTILVNVEKAASEGLSISVDNQLVKMTPTASGVTVNASLVGGGVTDAASFVWWIDDASLVNLSSITGSASLVPTGASGVTTLHVRHPKAADTIDILVMVSAFDTFSFAASSSSLKTGAISFIPMRVPPSSGKLSIEYEITPPSAPSRAPPRSLCSPESRRGTPPSPLP
jgi:hypothetical protein